MLPKERVARLEQGLIEARETISPYYDDIFREVPQRISADGSAGKADIAMLSFWKRLRADTPWVIKLLEWPDADVQKVELELTDRGPRFYARYITLIEQCRAQGAEAGSRWSARDVDLALWILGGK